MVEAQGTRPGADEPGSHTSARVSRRRRQGLGLVVLVIGAIVTGLFAWLVHDVDARTESRLLRLKTREVGTVLRTATPPLQTSLSAAVDLAAGTNGDPDRFRSFMSGFVGPGKSFLGASLWRQGDATTPLATVGDPVRLPASPVRFASFLRAAEGTRKNVSITGLLDGDAPRLGYAFPATGSPPAFVVYAESPLPSHGFTAIPQNQAFSDLRFAIYLGARPSSSAVVLTNSRTLPIPGRTSHTVAPYGTTTLLLVAAPIGHLSGTLSANLWWYVALVGGLFTLAAAASVERLVRQRVAAEGLNLEVRRLLGEQRTIAESLQRALLPKSLPDLPDIEIAARYRPGVNGMEIGGDWYDVIPLDGHRVFFVIGDVSGRGVEAGSVMASLRFAIRGFVSEGHRPDVVLNSLARLLDLQTDHHFATVLCGVVDVRTRNVMMANAGHLPPLLISDGHGEFLDVAVGTPIGAVPDVHYRPTTLTLPDRATLLIYTDGLVERRGETLDLGLRRLQQAAEQYPGETLEALLDSVLDRLAHGASDDDTAMLGLRWSS